MSRRHEPSPSSGDLNEPDVPSTEQEPEIHVFPRLSLAGRVLPPEGMPRRLALRRVALVGSLALAGICALVLVVREAARWAHETLAGQQTYQLVFEDIALDPPPPAWIKSGAKGLLNRVASRARHDTPLRVLDLDPETLRRDFPRESPWVREVLRIERAYPNRVRVELDYREPVALVPVRDGSIVVDRDGVVLPADDLDLKAAGPLIRLVLAPRNATADHFEGQPGHALAYLSGDSKSGRTFAEAASLAAFFRDKGAAQGPPSAPIRIVYLLPDPSHPGSFYAQTDHGNFLQWGHAPGHETSGEPSAEAKWTALHTWLDDQARSHHGRLDQYLSTLKPPRQPGEEGSILAFEHGTVVVQSIIRKGD